MYACICRGVRESEIVGAIHGGAGTVAEVGAVCDAGTDCGACHSSIAALIDEHSVIRACVRLGQVAEMRAGAGERGRP